MSLGTVHPLLYVWNRSVHVKSDLPPKARAQKSNLYEVTASFVFQACGSFICMVFSQCNASWLKQTNLEWVGEHWKTPVAMLCFWPRRGSDWSPIEVLALCPCVSFGLTWQGQELCPSLVADQPQKVFVETSIANNFFLFSFMTWIFFQNCYFSMSVTYLGTWNFVPEALGIQSSSFPGFWFCTSSRLGKPLPVLTFQKIYFGRCRLQAVLPFATRESFFSCHLCGYKLILGEKLKVFCRIFFLSVRVIFRLNI